LAHSLQSLSPDSFAQPFGGNRSSVNINARQQQRKLLAP
jgi:hypothetical protein